MSDTTKPAQQPRTVRDLMIVLSTAAAAWGAVKYELSTLVKSETTMATIALKSDATAVITHRLDSATNALAYGIELRFRLLEHRMDSTIESIPEPQTITRTFVVPGPPDSAQAAQLTDHIAHLEDVARQFAIEGARQRNKFDQWEDWIKRNGFLQRRGNEKKNGDGY